MVAGQGTLGLELVAQVRIMDEIIVMITDDILLCVQVPDMQFLFMAVGGGGLVSGLAAAVKCTQPGVVVVGCQPAASPVMARR